MLFVLESMYNMIFSVNSITTYSVCFHIHLFCVCSVQMCMCYTVHVEVGGQAARAGLLSLFSHSSRWVLGLRLRSSCLAPSAVTHWASSLLRLSLLHSGLPSDSLGRWRWPWAFGLFPRFLNCWYYKFWLEIKIRALQQLRKTTAGPHPTLSSLLL